MSFISGFKKESISGRYLVHIEGFNETAPIYFQKQGSIKLNHLLTFPAEKSWTIILELEGTLHYPGEMDIEFIEMDPYCSFDYKKINESKRFYLPGTVIGLPFQSSGYLEDLTEVEHFKESSSTAKFNGLSHPVTGDPVYNIKGDSTTAYSHLHNIKGAENETAIRLWSDIDANGYDIGTHGLYVQSQNNNITDFGPSDSFTFKIVDSTTDGNFSWFLRKMTNGSIEEITDSGTEIQRIDQRFKLELKALEDGTLHYKLSAGDGTVYFDKSINGYLNKGAGKVGMFSNVNNSTDNYLESLGWEKL